METSTTFRKIFLYGAGLLLLTTGCAMSQTEWDLQKAQMRRDYVDSHPELPPTIRDQILHGSISKGMTVEQVQIAWPSTQAVGSRSVLTDGGDYRETEWRRTLRHSSGAETWQLRNANPGRYETRLVFYTFHFDHDGRLTEWFQW